MLIAILVSPGWDATTTTFLTSDEEKPAVLDQRTRKSHLNKKEEQEMKPLLFNEKRSQQTTLQSS